jgi:hypothetical protein
MKKLLITLTATLVCAGAFGQGKLAFMNNTDQLIYFSTDVLMFNPADIGKTVGGFALAGSSVYSGAGGTMAALAGAPTLIAGLWAGATAGTLTLVAITTFGDVNFGGLLNPVNVTLDGLPGGTPAFFQIQVFDSRATSAVDAWNRGEYAGESPIFQATPQVAVYSPIYQKSSPVNSTLPSGTIVPTDYAGFPGYAGLIEVRAGMPPPPPQISTQPANATNYLGQSVNFTVTAWGWGAALSYQWQANGTNLYDGPNISGSTTSTLTLRAITLADAGSYRVFVFNVSGSVMSSVATLTVVGSPPIITEQPMSQVGYWGKSVAFTVAATNSPPFGYQWQKDGAPITGATARSLALTNLQGSDAGCYTVVVTNSVGSITSSNAYLIMNPSGVSLALYSGITIDGVPGRAYGIQYSAALSDGNGWQGMINLTLETPTELWFDVQPATQQQRYYRVVPGPISIP